MTSGKGNNKKTFNKNLISAFFSCSKFLSVFVSNSCVPFFFLHISFQFYEINSVSLKLGLTMLSK